MWNKLPWQLFIDWRAKTPGRAQNMTIAFVAVGEIHEALFPDF